MNDFCHATGYVEAAGELLQSDTYAIVSSFDSVSVQQMKTQRFRVISSDYFRGYRQTGPRWLRVEAGKQHGPLQTSELSSSDGWRDNRRGYTQFKGAAI